ncbi:MAG: hypothetical protein ACREQ9_08980, partial [Candidatus Binatia bacterium]
KEHFAAAGYDPVYGARPLKRLLQREIETALARRILAGEIGESWRFARPARKREKPVRTRKTTPAARSWRRRLGRSSPALRRTATTRKKVRSSGFSPRGRGSRTTSAVRERHRR